MRAGRILESSLYVTDLAAAERFYGDVLGLEPLARVANRHAFFHCGDGVLLLFNAQATREPLSPDARFPVPPHGAEGQVHLCFAATEDEIAVWKDRLIDQGVGIEADFVWPSGGRSIYFRDPSGNSLEFAEPRIWDIR